MTIRAILWGTGYENTLLLGELYSPVTDREERDGSAHDVDGAGADVAWIEGRDYTLEADIRWIPDNPGGAQTQVSGPVAFQGFLDWARAGNAFRFVPDSTVPLFYVDACYLIEPRKGFGQFENIKRSVHLKIRNAGMDFHQALRGIMFEYAPGSDIAAITGLGLTYTGDAGRYADVNGIVQTVVANLLRDRHYDVARRVALIEQGRTNLVLWSEALDNAAWTKTNTTITANAVVAPDGATTADKLVETAVNAVHDGRQTVTITAGNVVVVSGFFKAGERTQGRLTAFNGADSFIADFDTAAGGSIGTAVGGASSIKLSRIVALGNGWWYVWVSGIVNAGSTSITCQWQLRKAGAASYLGTVLEGAYYWGCQAEQVSVTTLGGHCAPAFYIPTTTATVARAADVFSKPWPWQKQAMWFYVKFIENGVANGGSSDGGQPSLTCIGQFGAALRTLLCGNASGAYSFRHGDNVTTRTSSVALSPALGDVVELLAVVFSDDAVQLFGRKNGGSTTTGTKSAAGVATPQYAYLNLGIGRDGPTTVGLIEVQAVKVGQGSSILTIDGAVGA